MSQPVTVPKVQTSNKDINQLQTNIINALQGIGTKLNNATSAIDTINNAAPSQTITFKAYAINGNDFGPNVPLAFSTIIYDTASGYNASTGQYKVQTGDGGYWRIGGVFQSSGGSTAPGNVYLMVNGTFVDYIINTCNTSFLGNVVSGWTETKVKDGDLINLATDSSVVWASSTFLVLTRIGN